MWRAEPEKRALLPEREGVAASLGAAELAALEQLRARLSPVPIDTITAVWFLRARCRKGIFDVEVTARMYMAHLAWREAERVDDVLTEPPLEDAALEAALRGGLDPRMLGLDCHGRPVMFMPFNGVDLGRLGKRGVTQAMVMRRYIRSLEQVRLAVAAAANPFAGHLQIQQIGGQSVGKFMRSWRFWMEMNTVGANNYPELLGCACIVGGPAAAAWVVEKVKAVLDPRTAAKLELHSGEPSVALVPRLISHAQLPAELLPNGQGAAAAAAPDTSEAHAALSPASAVAGAIFRIQASNAYISR